jgi:hypothetical protein
MHTSAKQIFEMPPNFKPSDTTRSGRTMAMLWVIFTKSNPLPWMIDPATTHLHVDADGYTIAMLWIIYVGTPPPQWMQHDNNIRTKQGETISDVWLHYVSPHKSDNPSRDERLNSIPLWMRRSTDDTFDLDPSLVIGGKTFAMNWIELTKTEPLKWMRHDPRINCDVNSIAKIWIVVTKSNPPRWMRTDAQREDGSYMSLLQYWIVETKTEPPQWMIDDYNDNYYYPDSNRSYNPAIMQCWIDFIRTEPPAWLRYRTILNDETKREMRSRWSSAVYNVECPKWLYKSCDDDCDI